MGMAMFPPATYPQVVTGLCTVYLVQACPRKVPLKHLFQSNINRNRLFQALPALEHLTKTKDPNLHPQGRMSPQVVVRSGRGNAAQKGCADGLLVQ